MMTPDEMRAKLQQLGWTQAELARRIDRGDDAVSSWATGRTKIPRYVEVILEQALKLQRASEDLRP